MIEVNKYSKNGELIGKANLPEELFNCERETEEAVLYEVVKMYLANQRQGTSASKGRSEVQGSTKKLFRQKGTGNARVGNRRTPVRVGGGVAFGPSPKDWTSKIPKKKKRLALKIALTKKAKDGNVFVVENLDYDAPNTKAADMMLNSIVSEKGRKLVLFDSSDKALVKSFSNIPYVMTDRADCLHPYEVLHAKYLILTEDALQKIGEVFS